MLYVFERKGMEGNGALWMLLSDLLQSFCCTRGWMIFLRTTELDV